MRWFMEMLAQSAASTTPLSSAEHTSPAGSTDGVDVVLVVGLLQHLAPAPVVEPGVLLPRVLVAEDEVPEDGEPWLLAGPGARARGPPLAPRPRGGLRIFADLRAPPASSPTYPPAARW